MRKIFTVLLVAVSVGMMARTPEQAAIIASEFITQSQANPVQRVKRAAAATTLSQPVEWVYTQYQMNELTPAVYVFNSTAGEGFVLVAAEDNARAVLGYSDEGSFDEENIPDNMRVWLQMYADEMARASKISSVVGAQRTIDYYPSIEPLLGKTAWNQSEPYNNHCPIDPKTNERSVTGCMATATAQIMYHHKYPKTGTGTYSYWCGWETLSVDFSKATYDWDNMLPTYRGNYTQVESDAVAQLMYHVGVACNMWYGSASSGAGMGTSMKAVVRNFGYDAGIKVLLKDYMDEDMILDEMIADLQASRPILIEALTKRNEGHAFVCDGMQSDGFIHINWGWGGYSDGYFALSVMNPQEQGIGGASDAAAFTESVTIYTGIQPDKGGESKPLIVANNVELSASALAKREKVAVTITNFTNYGIAKESGKVAFMLYKDSALYQTVKTGQSWDLSPMYYYSSLNANASMTTVPEGEYEMVVGIDVTNKKEYPIYVLNHGVKRYQMTVTSDSIFLKEIIKKSEYYGAEFALMQVTDLSAKTGANNLRLVLQTEDFATTNKGEVKSGGALALDLFPVDVNSVMGTYMIDGANRKKPGSMSPAYTKMLALEDGKQVNETMVEGIATISQVMGGHYVVEYKLKSNTREFVGKRKITSSVVKCYRQVGNTTKSFTLTNETTTPTQVDWLYDWVCQLPSDELVSMPVYVQGIVAQVEEIATASGEAAFYLSADGKKTNALYCSPMKWLDGSDFVTGNELTANDTVVIVGNVQYMDMTTPTITGYVCDYRKGQPNVNTSITSVTDNGVTISVQGLQLTVASSRACDTYICNLAGEVVAMAPAAEQQTVLLPVAGCYIVRHGDIVKKIMIQ